LHNPGSGRASPQSIDEDRGVQKYPAQWS
jgi:hypothetical protein